jgi:heat shock protein HslJ
LVALLVSGCAAPDPSEELPVSDAEGNVTPPASRADTAGSAEVVSSLRGMYRYWADAAIFTDCETGSSYWVVPEGDALALERAYLGVREEPGEPVLVTLRGATAIRPGMEGTPVDALVVETFGGTWPGMGCEGPVDGVLEGVEWVLVGLPGGPDVPSEARATLTLGREGGLLSGSTGCNRYRGAYELEGGLLTLSVTGSTRMACGEALMRLEASFLEALRVTGSFRLRGSRLDLLGESGVVARLESGS